MKNCPYCGYSNYDTARSCRKCETSFVAAPGTVYAGKHFWMGPENGKHIRSRALTMVVLGLLIKVYWGGYGPWPTIDSPTLVSIRYYLEPIMLYGGLLIYLLGWLANYV